jgi:hypothetical protein
LPRSVLPGLFLNAPNWLAETAEGGIIRKMRQYRPKRGFSLVVKPQGDGPKWMWEIVRAPVPLGVRLYGEDFPSEYAARFAGESAMRGLLQGIDKEQPNA